jgi:integrase
VEVGDLGQGGMTLQVRFELPQAGGDPARSDGAEVRGYCCGDLCALDRVSCGEQVQRQERAGMAAADSLVFASRAGTQLDAANVRRGFRRVARAAGLVAAEWTPRELRHSFVSLLSDDGMSTEQISRLVGHSGTTVTEAIYRHQIRPVVEEGAMAMDRIFRAK